jgi:DNA-directed RNA polymerase specialized sigma24 family protein
VSERTCCRWCQEEDQFPTASNDAVENVLKVFSADGKERPAERLSPVDLAERRRRVRELRNAGYTLEEIAEELGVSLGTAELYPGRGEKSIDFPGKPPGPPNLAKF